MNETNGIIIHPSRNGETDKAELPEFVPVLIFDGVDCRTCNNKSMAKPGEVIICRSIAELFQLAKKRHKAAARINPLVCLDDNLILYHSSAFVSAKALINQTIDK